MKRKVVLCNEFTCTQCFACQQACPMQCISRIESNAGFYIPDIDYNKCIGCGKCISVCHKLNDVVSNKPKVAYACWTKDVDERRKSSSGGAFSALADSILNIGGVVYGATMRNDLHVCHVAIDDAKDLQKLQGSKYVQSELGNSYKDIKQLLIDKRPVLFTGTPCQVASLRTYLNKDYETLYTCDLVCHGVPSQKSFNCYLSLIGINNKVDQICFRFLQGWGFRMTARHKGQSGFKIIPPIKSFYMRAFNKGLMFSESCYACPYASENRVGDITIGDYWGIGSQTPFAHDTSRGVSLALANTLKGEFLLESCSKLFKEKRPLAEAIMGNDNLRRPSIRPKGRDTFYDDLRVMSMRRLCSKYGLHPTPRDYMRILKQMLYLIIH